MVKISPIMPGQTIIARTLPWWLRYSPARIQFLDDMEGVLKWSQASGTITKDSSISAFEGTNTLKLVTGAVAGNLASAAVYVGPFPRSKFAFQCRWHAKNAADTTLRYFQAFLAYYTGSTVYRALVRYLKNQTNPQNKWQYLDQTVAYLDIPEGSQTLDTIYDTHHFLRFTVDFSETPPHYIEFEFDHLIITPTNLFGTSAADATPPLVMILIDVCTDVALASTVFVDAVCLSDKEP